MNSLLLKDSNMYSRKQIKVLSGINSIEFISNECIFSERKKGRKNCGLVFKSINAG